MIRVDTKDERDEATSLRVFLNRAGSRAFLNVTLH